MKLDDFKVILKELGKSAVKAAADGVLFSFKTIESLLLSLLKRTLVKVVLLKLLKRAAGFKVWLITFLVEHAFDLVLKPILHLMLVKGALYYDKTRGKIIVKKIKKAQEEDNEDNYNDNIDAIFE